MTDEIKPRLNLLACSLSFCFSFTEYIIHQKLMKSHSLCRSHLCILVPPPLSYPGCRCTVGASSRLSPAAGVPALCHRQVQRENL